MEKEFFNSIGLVKVPNLGGKWKGFLRSSVDKFTDKVEVTLEITQTWTEICITLTDGKSRSISQLACISVNNPAERTLSHDYLNTPYPEHIQTMDIHRGICQLRIEEENMLRGTYYNNRQIPEPTWGEIELARVLEDHSEYV